MDDVFVTIAYFLMLSFYLVHELDAVDKHEWRVLPLTSFMPDAVGKTVFVLCHLPLFFLFCLFDGFNAGSWLAAGLSAFAIIHVGVHWIFRKHPANEFDKLQSWSLIVGTGVFGAMHLTLLLTR